MKFSSFFLSFFLMFFVDTCNKSRENFIEITGTLKASGINSYQYGTHIIRNKDSYYALKSDNFNLTRYEGQKVTIHGKAIEGYPVDGGPEFILVKEIKEY
ncbi:hypothetical protein [Autumnicola musiva]|uniref:Uncharacterized protein n=1 Tax=Autumnicola musiva TaxID=3075589 RepID=A0ABU3D4L0_9FLAO|nr:hypothetical protein [Zunongwangia sp. F117]MDT0676456.1 hypothetical protein [Zunongwangia sp. F117]